MSDHVTIPGLVAVVRHCWLTVLIGKCIPIVVFLALLPLVGIDLAVLGALVWSLGVIGFQRSRGQRIAGLVVLSAVGNSVKSALALATGSTFLYFAQPTLSTIVIGIAFLVSVPLGQPLAERLIHDFCPLEEATASHPEFLRFCRTGSLLWGATSLTNGAITIYLLSTQTLTAFLVIKAFLGPLLTGVTFGAGALLFRSGMHRAGVNICFARRLPEPPLQRSSGSVRPPDSRIQPSLGSALKLHQRPSVSSRS